MSDSDFTVRRFSDDFAKLLREKILGGDLLPGERLNEVHLAERYGISRSPIREALQALSGEGLVTFVGGKGAFVSELTADELINLGEVREALETQAARIVALSSNDETISALERCVDVSDDPGGSDTDLHTTLLRLTANPRLEFLGNSTIARLRLARTRSASREDRVAAAVIEHREIVDAIRNHNADAAAQLMRTHIVRATSSAARDYHTDLP